MRASSVIRALLLVAALLVLAVVFVPGSALAARGHEFSTTFAGPCAHEPCAGDLKEPDGVAVNEATGDVYVVDKGADRVARFSATGVYLGEFNGSGLLSGEGSAAGGLMPKLPGERETGRFDEPEGIAVDNSCELRKLSKTECEADDPSNGDVYVVDAGADREGVEHRVIDKYSARGEYLGQITEAEGQQFSTYPLGGVGVDATGKVWVYREFEKIDGFSDALANEFVEAVPVPGLVLSGFAVDGAGDFYVHHSVGGEPRITKLDSSGSELIAKLGSEASDAVAADQVSNDSAVCNVTAVEAFDPNGILLERLGEEKGEKHLTQCAGIGVNAGAGESEGSGSLYVADAGTDEIVVFGQTKPEAPRVERESESVANLTAGDAELGAEINPRSEAGEAPTEYQFEYGRCASASGCSSSPYEARVPLSAGQIAADYNAHPVAATIQGLAASTTYHFRAVASNAHGAGEPGEELTFTTEGVGGELVLPDDRGWELVSPPDKQGALVEPISEEGVVQAAAGGDGITYLTNAPIESQPRGGANQSQVLSTRTSTNWESRDIAIPHSGATGHAVGPGPEYKFFNPELTLSAVQPFGEFVPQLSEEASESTAYLHDLSSSCGSSCFHPLVTGEAGLANVPPGTVFGEAEECIHTVGHQSIVNCGPLFIGASEDLSHVVLRAKAPLKEGAGNGQLYEWSGGQLAQVSLLPNNEPTPEGAATLGLRDQAARGAISSDGSRIVWGAEERLYRRDMTRGETVQLDKAEEPTPGNLCGRCESGGGQFQIASADGSRVFFTDVNRLTGDSGAEPVGGSQKADLYEYDFDKPVGERLADLTPKHGLEGAAVQGAPNQNGAILGAGTDGEFVYFVANGVQSEEANARGQHAVSGQPNLYVRREGRTSFIATLAEGDKHDWYEELAGQPTRVSPNGQFLELMSEARLTGYDNRDVATGEPVAEVYLYDAATGKLSCASCEPSGARPVGVEYLGLQPGNGGLVGGPVNVWPATALVAANVPGWTNIGTGGQQKSRYQPRYLSNSGRLFFDSDDALVPQDSNGTQDVYEYEPPGVGSCGEASETFSARSGGCVSLISSGSSTQESAFMDASVSGDDVFFLTAAKLSKLDTDASLDVYDAHVCSDSPCITSSNVQSPPCTTEASCKAAPSPQPSIFGAPPSATFQGPGNLAPAAAVKAKAKPLTRAQKLAAALKVCKKDRSKSKRAKCQEAARKKFGPLKRTKKKAKAKGNNKRK